MTSEGDRRLGIVLVLLAGALALNTALGPAVSGMVTYPFSETLLLQTIGLELVSLLIVVPWSLGAAALVYRDHPAGTLAAVPPSAYTAYMFAQYVVGPQYLAYRPVILLHLGLFILGGLLLATAWRRTSVDRLPSLSVRRRRRSAVGLVLLAAFICARYLTAFQGMLTGAPLSPEFLDDPSMYWTIFLLDLGIVVPVTIATAVGLRRGATWASGALYGIAGWYTLVPISVSAMGLVMYLNDDPNASLASVAVLASAAVLFTGFAGWVFRPLADRA